MKARAEKMKRNKDKYLDLIEQIERHLDLLRHIQGTINRIEEDRWRIERDS